MALTSRRNSLLIILATSSVVAEVLPEVWPGLPQLPAEVDFGVFGLLIGDSVGIRHVPGGFAGFEVLVAIFLIQPNHDEGLWRRTGIAIGPERIDSADCPGQPVSRTVQVDGACLAVVRRQNARPGAFGRRY